MVIALEKLAHNFVYTKKYLKYGCSRHVKKQLSSVSRQADVTFSVTVHSLSKQTKKKKKKNTFYNLYKEGQLDLKVEFQ